MEIIINFAIVALTFLLIFIVEKKVNRRLPSKQAIENYQKELDENDLKLESLYHVRLKHSAEKEIVKNRLIEGGLRLILGGVFMILALIVLIFMDYFTLSIIGITILSAIYLIIAGLLKFSESKKRFLEVLGTIILVIIATIICINIVSNQLFGFF